MPSLPAFEGTAATAKKIKRPTRPPQNPFMAPDPNSNIHNDAWMTDAYRRPGPLGSSLVARSNGLPPALCGSLAFDSRGRIVGVCPSLFSPPQARIIDPQSLEIIASYDHGEEIGAPASASEIARMRASPRAARRGTDAA
jgi:hypothetical protein